MLTGPSLVAVADMLEARPPQRYLCEPQAWHPAVNQWITSGAFSCSYADG